MTYRVSGFILVAALLAGCGGSKPARVTAASFTRAERKQAEAAGALVLARDHLNSATAQHAKARAGLVAAKASHRKSTGHNAEAVSKQGAAQVAIAQQKQAIGKLRPRVALLMQNVPPELRAEVSAVQFQVDDLDLRNAEAEAANHAAAAAQAAVTAAQSEVGTYLESTNAAVHLAGGEVQAATVAEKIASDAVEESRKELATARADDAAKVATANGNADIADAALKELGELKRKNWIRRALEAVAALLIVGLGILWFLGKLSFTSLRAATAAAGAFR